MIILDTNVVSEPIKRDPNPAVIAWLDAQEAETLFLTATSLAELLAGVEVLPMGRRRIELAEAIHGTVERLFGPRILPFDRRAADAYATLFARARTSGYSIPLADGQIAAIAAVHKCEVATRDTRPFLAAGVRVINPWNES